jgi:hypothetical protein
LGQNTCLSSRLSLPGGLFSSMRPTECPPNALHPFGLSYKVNIRSSVKPRFFEFDAAMSARKGTIRDCTPAIAQRGSRNESLLIDFSKVRALSPARYRCWSIAGTACFARGERVAASRNRRWTRVSRHLI